MKTRLLVLLLVAAGITGVLLQRRAISEARRELETRRGEMQQIEKLTRENALIGQLRRENLEIERMRGGNQELHKLRNEVRQLREQARQLPGLRAENGRLRSLRSSSSESSRPAPADLDQPIPVVNLTYAGYATPEAAFRTMVWAMSEGNIEQVLASVAPELRDKMKTKVESEGAETLKRESAAMNRFRVVATKMTSDTAALLGIQIEQEGRERREEVAIPFKLFGSEWKLDMTP